MNNASVIMGVQLYLWDSISSVLGCILRSRIAGSCHNSFFFLMRKLHIIFHSGCAILHSSLYCTRVPISPYLCQNLLLYVCLFVWFDSSHFVGYDVMSHVALICISLIINNVNIFLYAFWPYFFGDMSSQVICQCFNQVVLLLLS